MCQVLRRIAPPFLDAVRKFEGVLELEHPPLTGARIEDGSLECLQFLAWAEGTFMGLTDRG